MKIMQLCVDIPKCDSVYITYNCKSKIKIVQRLCRSVRIDPDNKNKIAYMYV